MPKPGTVFQVVPEGGNHFWVVISAPLNGKVLVVNITDEKHCPDSPCKLAVGEHPVLIKASAVHYRKTREFEAVKIDEQLQNPDLVRQLHDCTADLFQRIIDGARNADGLTLRFLDYLPPE
jgi:sensor domain CHASE-containing protein